MESTKLTADVNLPVATKRSFSVVTTPEEPFTIDHELKIDPERLAEIIAGSKTHEIRVFDRDFQVGSTLKLNAYDLAHVESLVTCIAHLAGNYKGGSVCLHGMTLPYKNTDEAHDGYMEFRIEKNGLEPIAFGVEFGGKERDRIGFAELTLESLQEAADLGDTASSMASVFNFDELWLFANKLVQRLGLTSVSIAFGGIGGLQEGGSQ